MPEPGLQALKEENIEVVLVNSNPATIMTDTNIADRVYIEPLTVEVVKKIIIKKNRTAYFPLWEGRQDLILPWSLQSQDF